LLEEPDDQHRDLYEAQGDEQAWRGTKAAICALQRIEVVDNRLKPRGQMAAFNPRHFLVLVQQVLKNRHLVGGFCTVFRL
jgi:hypothetical protein